MKLKDSSLWLGEIKKPILKQKVTLQYMKQCCTLSESYA